MDFELRKTNWRRQLPRASLTQKSFGAARKGYLRIHTTTTFLTAVRHINICQPIGCHAWLSMSVADTRIAPMRSGMSFTSCGADLGSQLKKKTVAEAFRSTFERSWSKHLDDATRLVYLAALAFYRHRRGKGATAVDISNFFYRSKQHIAFEKFWASSVNSRRAHVNKSIKLFLHELDLRLNNS